MSDHKREVDVAGAVLILVLFLSYVLFVGEPDIHDAILQRLLGGP